MALIVDKADGLARLERHRHELLGGREGCVMCALVAAAPTAGELVAENAHGVLLLDRFGNREGHLIVVARTHCEDTHELGWEAYRDMQHLAYLGSVVVTRVLAPVRVFIAALGSQVPLPMTFPHFHLHVLPVYDTDERARPAHVFSWTSGIVIYDDAEAHALTAKLRTFWPR